MRTGKVTVVMCTYNGAAFVRDQIDSICSQTYTDLEILIADDRSTDETWKIIQEFANIDSRIQARVNPVNLGFKENFNQVVLRATGDYVAFSDQDDIWHPEKIERLMHFWPDGHPLVYCHSARFVREVVSWDTTPPSHYTRFSGTDARQMAIFNSVSGHALVMERALLPLVFPAPAGIVYDWYAGMIAAANGGVAYLPQTLVLQRVHEHNATVEAGYEYRRNKTNKSFRARVELHLRVFKDIPNLSQKQQAFITRLSALWTASLTSAFSPSLFRFIVRNRAILFANKKNSISLFSAMKHTYRLLRNN